jgi:hypothetical protein
MQDADPPVQPASVGTAPSVASRRAPDATDRNVALLCGLFLLVFLALGFFSPSTYNDDDLSR